MLTRGHNNINVALPVPQNAQPGPDGVYVIAFFNPTGKVNSCCLALGFVRACMYGRVSPPSYVPNHRHKSLGNNTHNHQNKPPHKSSQGYDEALAEDRKYKVFLGDGWNNQVRAYTFVYSISGLMRTFGRNWVFVWWVIWSLDISLGVGLTQTLTNTQTSIPPTQASDDAKPRTGLRIGGQPGNVEVAPK